MADEKDQAMESEMAFLTAMRRYRQAKESNDPEAIAAAERALQEQVRSELVQREGGCS